MSLATPVGYHTKWNMADSDLPTICHREAL